MPLPVAALVQTRCDKEGLRIALLVSFLLAENRSEELGWRIMGCGPGEGGMSDHFPNPDCPLKLLFTREENAYRSNMLG